MFNKLCFQSYTVRDYMKHPAVADAAFAEISSYGYTECHGAFWSPDDPCASLLKNHGISLIGNHYDTEKILNSPDETMRVHESWGAVNIGVGGIWGDEITKYDCLMAFIEKYNNAAKIYAQNGFKLTYHNHHHEFMRIDGYRTVFDVLYENLDPDNVSFVLDTCWLAVAGGDICSWLEKLEGRIDILHLKDVTVFQNPHVGFIADATDVGYGNIDWDRVIPKAEEIGVKHFCVEQDGPCREQLETLKKSGNFLKKYMKK